MPYKPQACAKNIERAKKQGKQVGQILVSEVAKIKPSPMYIALNCFKKDSGAWGLTCYSRTSVTSPEIPDDKLIARVIECKHVLKNNIKFVHTLLSITEKDYENIDNEEVRNYIYSVFEKLQELKHPISLSLIDPLCYGSHHLQQRNLITNGTDNFSQMLINQLKYCFEVYYNFVDLTYSYLKSEQAKKYLQEYKEESLKLELLAERLILSIKTGEKNIDFLPDLLNLINKRQVTVGIN